MRILYVEDNQANLFLVQRVARMGGHEVITYSTGESALANFDSDKPNLILMDIQLSGELTGLDVVKRLRASGHMTPVVAVTAYAMVGDREKCMEAGCDAYLSKPLPVTELVEIIKRYESQGAAPAAIAQPVAAAVGVAAVSPVVATSASAPATQPASTTSEPAVPQATVTAQPEIVTAQPAAEAASPNKVIEPAVAVKAEAAAPGTSEAKVEVTVPAPSAEVKAEAAVPATSEAKIETAAPAASAEMKAEAAAPVPTAEASTAVEDDTKPSKEPKDTTVKDDEKSTVEPAPNTQPDKSVSV